jgi:hypothetical protein
MIDSDIDTGEQEVDHMQDWIASRSWPRLLALLADGIGDPERIDRIIWQTRYRRSARIGIASVLLDHGRSLHG